MKYFIKNYFRAFYWTLVVILLSCMFRSVMGSFAYSLFLSVMMMPGVLFVKYFYGDISFANPRQGILHTVYLAIIVLLIEYLALFFVYWMIYRFSLPNTETIIINPFFIWFIVISLISIEKLVSSKLAGDNKEEDSFICFISERKKIHLKLDMIKYIESRDPEIFVLTIDGHSYPTRMKISQWNTVLDDRFIRIHRAFLVNIRHITHTDSRSVYLQGGQSLEISRKYRDAVGRRLYDSIADSLSSQ